MTSIDWPTFICGAVVALCFATAYVVVAKEVERRRIARNNQRIHQILVEAMERRRMLTFNMDVMVRADKDRRAN